MVFSQPNAEISKELAWYALVKLSPRSISIKSKQDAT
jgi:hypothetical protein